MKFENGSYVHSTLDEGYDFFITDKWKKKFHFRIATFPVPSGFLSEAIEVITDKKEREPYMFMVLSGFESDEEHSELLLKAKIKRGINRRYLMEKNGNLQIRDSRELRGRIDWTGNHLNSAFENIFVIDGKRITIEQFVEMLQGSEGWNFRFTIHDMTDDEMG